MILARESSHDMNSGNLTPLYLDCLALTLRTFFRHRKEMNEYLSSCQEFSYNKYSRLMVIACPGHTVQSAGAHRSHCYANFARQRFLSE